MVAGDLSGVGCFVTGGANGIGREIVRSLAAEGAKVCFCDTDCAAGRALEQELTDVYFIEADVRDAAALESALRTAAERTGGIQVLVNNAGVGDFAPLGNTTAERFDNILATNLRPVFVASKVFASMRPAGVTYGRIINIASTRWLQSEAGTEGYSASKGGIVSLTHALMASLAGTGTTVNCISPGWIETGDYATLSAADHAQHPSGRVGKPSDIARACLFLAHPHNGFINGHNLVVDGGMTRRMIYV